MFSFRNSLFEYVFLNTCGSLPSSPRRRYRKRRRVLRSCSPALAPVKKVRFDEYVKFFGFSDEDVKFATVVAPPRLSSEMLVGDKLFGEKLLGRDDNEDVGSFFRERAVYFANGPAIRTSSPFVAVLFVLILNKVVATVL